MPKRFRWLKRQRESGFTLIEAVIALAILGVIAAGIALGLISAIKGVSFTDSRETAKNVAETQMEYVKASKYSSAYSLYTPSPLPSYWNQYVTNISVTQVEGNPDPNIQMITVNVSYTDIYDGGPAEVVLEDFKVNE
jgi:prepilin-type N-terminal cleavage/methylation domain-containing protein